LLANTANSTTPYFLTANHCMSTQTVAGTIVVYWNYQSSTCRTPGSSSSGSPLSKTIATHSQSGSTLRATNAASDFTLIELSTAVPSAANPYFSGWDRSGTTPSSAVGIHHPAGHEKRISVENHTEVRTLPSVCLANDALHALLGRSCPFLTAKRLLSNQTFRDIYRTDTLDVDQRLKITSLTFLFTDLRGSTELYERVGDLAAFDLVRAHFGVLNEIVASEAGAVVKTIGDAVMATFPRPDQAIAAALRMREAMRRLNEARRSEDLLLKIGIHEGPCIAVTLNERQDYFGQTVNIASRVQHLATSREIFATGVVLDDPRSLQVLATRGVTPQSHPATLRGIASEVSIYAIP